jgi:hypothetical protein
VSAGPAALHAIRTVAQRLGDLREHVVFVGGVVRGLLITDAAVEGSRPTKDVDVIAAGIATRAAYYTQVHKKLQELGFREDTSEGAPICRWRLEDLIVDVMPQGGEVMGFSNRWYLHAVDTATRFTVPAAGDEEAIEIRLVTAPSFLATKLEAFADRGGGDFDASHDLEDIVAVLDGRSTLVDEVEREPSGLRAYIAEEVARHLSRGLAEALPGHLAGGAASQARLPLVMCALDRLRRCPRILSLGEVVQSRSAGQPGANGEVGLGPWRYEILGGERRRASAARDHVVVRARLTNVSRVAGTVGDGRSVHVEDARGLRFPPLYKLVARELEKRGLPGTYDQAVPDEPFETCWVYELPREAKGLRVILPFDGCELPIGDIGGPESPMAPSSSPDPEAAAPNEDLELRFDELGAKFDAQNQKLAALESAAIQTTATVRNGEPYTLLASDRYINFDTTDGAATANMIAPSRIGQIWTFNWAVGRGTGDANDQRAA